MLSAWTLDEGDMLRDTLFESSSHLGPHGKSTTFWHVAKGNRYVELHIVPSWDGDFAGWGSDLMLLEESMD